MRGRAPGDVGQQLVPHKREAELVPRGEAHVLVEPEAGEEVRQWGVGSEYDAGLGNICTGWDGMRRGGMRLGYRVSEGHRVPGTHGGCYATFLFVGRSAGEEISEDGVGPTL